MASSVQIPVTQTGLEASIQAALRNAGKNATINLGANARQINALAQPLGRITGQADEFTKSMEAANARVFAFGASVGIINSVSNAFGALVKNTIAVEKSLTEINTVLGQSSSELEKFGGKLFEVAKNTGQSFDVVSKGALELARQGLGTEETLRRINDALILTRLSGLDAEKSVEGLTAAVNSFKSTGITTSEVLNKLVNVSQKYAVSEKDLIEGLKRSSSVAKQAGVSFDELVGIITAVQEKSAVGGAVIGNSFKTIFTRLQRTDTLDALQQLGVTVTDVQGKILPATKLLENLAGTVKSLNQIQLAEITEKVGGGFQIDKLIASLEDLGSASSVAFEATRLSAESANQAYAKNAALNKTLANLINETTLSAQELGATLGKLGVTDNAKNLLGFFNSLLESLQKILGEESALGDFAQGFIKGIGNLVTGPGLALFGAIILKLSKDLAQFGFASLKSFFGIGKAAKEIEAVEKSVANALASNINLQRQLFALEGDRAAQIKVMTDAIIQQEAAMRRMTSTSSSLAGPLYQAGVRGTNTGLRVPKAAGGYMPAVAKEASDINRGVGGAKAGDRPVVIPNFNFGGGQRGSIVAHTGEYAVPNFAGSGGTAIFNRDMVRSMGLPSGAKKIGAAGGLIPNFAIKGLSSNIPVLAGRVFESLLRGDKFINLTENKIEPDVKRGYYATAEAKMSVDAALKDSNFGVGKPKGNVVIVPKNSKKSNDEELISKKGSLIKRPTSNKFLRGNIFSIARKTLERESFNKYTNYSRIPLNASSGFIPNFAFNADTVRQYASDIEKYRQGGKYVFPDGTSGYESQIKNVLSRTVAKATINKQASVTKRQEEMQKKGAVDFFIDANSLGGIALVTPSRRGSTGILSAESKMLNLPHKPDGVLMDDRLVIKNIQSTGVPAKKDFEQISGEINKLFAGPIVSLAQSLYGKLYSGASGSEFASQLGQLRSTSKGGILPPGAEGQIFEAAGKAALTSMNQIASTFDPSKENRPFDFTNAASMKEMLGVKAVRGDAKRAGGSEKQFKETVNGLVKKSINDPQLKSGIFSQIKQQSRGRVLPENAVGGYVPNFVDLTKSEDYTKNQRKRSSKARTYRTASGVIGSLFKSLPDKFFSDGILGDAAQGLETDGILDLIKNNSLYAASFAGPKAVKFVLEAEKYGLKVTKGLQKKLASLTTKAVGKFKGFSSGFLPNFADPLKEAVGREMAAGVPSSQIYIDKNQSLKSAANPMGLMVANRRDEPAGGHQGISRAIKEGRNPKTYGAANGFVPNYADTPDISGYVGKTRSLALAEESRNYGKAWADLTTELRKATDDEKKARGKNKKAAQDRIKALEDDREALKKSSEATRKAITEQSKGLRGNGKTLTGKEATVQAKGGQKDMLGTIFAVQGAMSLLTGATEGSSSALGKFTNSLSSSLGNLATAGFAFQGLKQMVPEGNKFAGTLGKLGTAGMIAIAGFEAFKLGIDLYKIFSKDASEQVKKTEQAMAKFSDSVNQAGVSIEGLSKEARTSSLRSAEGSLYNLGAGIDLFDDIFGRAYKDPKMQEMYANAQYISGMSEEEIAQKFIKAGATKKYTVGAGRNERTEFSTDTGKARQVLSEITAMPQKGTEEYEKRIERLIQLRKEQQKIQKDIEAPFEKEAIMNRANLDLLEQQLSNRIAYKEAIFQQSSAEEISLEMQKEMLSFSEKDRMLADQKLSSLQSAKKLTLDQSKASFDVLKNSALLKSKVTDDVLGDVSRETFQEIAGISEKVADSIREQGGYTEVVRKKAEELLKGIDLEDKQRTNILNVLFETNKALTDQVKLEEKSNALNKFKTSIIEAQNFALEKQKEAAVYTFERNSKSNDVAKRRKDIELETFKIDAERRKIGASSAQSVAIDKEIIKKEIEAVNFKLNLDKKDLIIQLRKTLTEAALSSGMGIDQIKGLNLGAKNTQQQFQEAANQIAEAEKKAKIEKINAAFEELKLQSEASDYFQDAVKKSADYIKESVQSIFGFIGFKPKEESVIYGPELPNRSEFLDAQRQRAIDAVDQTAGVLGDAVNASFEEMELKTSEATNTIGQFNNSLLSAGASLITFAKLVSDVFLNLQDEITQNKFSYLTATDPQSIISAALQDTKLSTLKSGPATEDTIVNAADKVALLEKELEIKRATTTEAKIGAEFELQKLKEILPLRLELLKAETDEERIKIIDKIIAKEKERLPLAKRLESIFTSSPEEQKNRLEDTIVQASEQFKSNMIDGISEAIEGGKSLGDVLQNSAYEFVKAINKQLMSNLVDSVVGSGKKAASGGSGFLGNIMSSIGLASGGKVNGGSGTKDDVPAMLMGGEYVINKKAVQKYGPQFLEALNNGTIGGYAKGGKVQSGKGGFFTPGTYGLGGIEGTRNLLQFATQGYTSGAMDRITNVAGYGSIALEPESARLTNFGRSNSPQAEATRAAKEQAFGLYTQEINAQMEAAKQAEAEKDAFKKQLIMLGISAVGGAVMKAGSAGFNNVLKSGGSLTEAFKGVWSGSGDFGGLKNLFSGNFAESQVGSNKELAEYIFNNSDLDAREALEYASQLTGEPLEYKTPSSSFNPVGTGPFDAQGNYIEAWADDPSKWRKQATGGTIPSMGGVDTIPAMLSGGEFIMNRSAAQNIGAGNLQALNAGAGSIVTEEKTEELNDKLIAKLDELIEASGGGGSITINVEGSAGATNQTTSGQTSEQKQQLARQIKDAVVKVIQEEKRLGGSLRR